MDKLISNLLKPSGDDTHTLQLQCAAAKALMEQAEALVRGVIEDETPAAAGLHLPDIEQALCAILHLKALEGAALVNVASHPAFNYWVKATRRCNSEKDFDHLAGILPHIADFVWPAEALRGATTRVWQTLADDRGGLRCPGVKLFIELGEKYGGTRVDVLAKDGTVFLSTEDGVTRTVPTASLGNEQDVETPCDATIEQDGYAINPAPLITERGIELWSRDPWLRVCFTGTQQRTDGIKLFGTDDRWFEKDPDLDPYLHAFILLRHYWEEAYDEISRFTRVLVPMRSDHDSATRLAFTVSSRQGAIFVDGGEPYDIVDNLLHETAHVKLRQIQLLDDLLVHPHADEPRFSVPWRKDKRPIPGILEGVFVFSHVAELERRVGAKELGGPTDKLVKLAADIRHGLTILSSHAELTEAGKSFIAGLRPWVDELAAAAEQRAA